MDVSLKSKGIYSLPEEPGCVPALLVSTESLLPLLQKDRTLLQLRNVSKLPGLAGPVWAMPDAHEGYGFPIGGVAAFDADDPSRGMVSPGGVGYDINCGVRLAVVDLPASDVKQKAKELVDMLFRETPGGLGSKSVHLRASLDELDDLAEKGIDYLISQGLATKRDKECIEEYGRLAGADASKVSHAAKTRGKDQVGSIGSGNHFVEVQEIREIFDPAIAKSFGLEKERVAIMIHSGSRGYGHQVCSDYLSSFLSYLEREGIRIPDKELACAKLDSQEAHDYLSAMACAVNYAFCNRQLLLYGVRKTFSKVFGLSEEDVRLVYDVCHNVAKFEEHKILGTRKKVCVHRKGATRAFCKGRKELPGIYEQTGHPVIIPGSMGTASYVLVGTDKAMELTYGSTCHGAGRMMSRKQATQEFGSKDIQKELLGKGILLKSTGKESVAEEAPGAYKDIDAVIKAVTLAGICRPIAKMIPLCVVKG